MIKLGQKRRRERRKRERKKARENTVWRRCCGSSTPGRDEGEFKNKDSRACPVDSFLARNKLSDRKASSAMLFVSL